MKNLFIALLAFVKEGFSENGAASCSRILSGTTVATMLGCIVYVTARTKALPSNLGEAAIVIGAGFSGYAANRISGAFNNGKDQKGSTAL